MFKNQWKTKKKPLENLGSNHIFVTGGTANSTEVLDLAAVPRMRTSCPLLSPFPIENVKVFKLKIIK